VIDDVNAVFQKSSELFGEYTRGGCTCKCLILAAARLRFKDVLFSRCILAPLDVSSGRHRDDAQRVNETVPRRG